MSNKENARGRRLEPDARKNEILEAAVKVAKKVGYPQMRVQDVADAAGCVAGTVLLYFLSVAKLRVAVMREAIARNELRIIAQGLGISDPTARKADAKIKKAALESLL